MNESTIKSALVKTLRLALPGFVVIRHEDRFTAGVPDISVTGHGLTSWWEVKFANPRLHSRDVQRLTALRLASAGVCFYVVYQLEDDMRRVAVVHPHWIEDWESHVAWGATIFAHQHVATFVRQTHLRGR